MRYTKLGGTGLTVSRLCIGTMNFGFQCNEEKSRAILDRAAEAGITFIDTADVYPFGGGHDDLGRTEEIVGRWLQGKRERFIVATKAGGRMGPAQWNVGSSRKHLLEAIDGSLRRLGTDCVDLYQLHADDASTPLDETLEALDAIVRSGKARYVGASNFLAYRLARALGRSEVRGLVKLVSVQPRYNLLFREIERELLPLAAETQLGVMAYNPLAGGLLTGKHTPTSEPLPNTRFAIASKFSYKERYWHAREFATVEALRSAVSADGHSLATVAVAWVLANRAVTCAIVSASRPEQLADNLAAVDFKLDAPLAAQLDEISRQYRYGDAER